MLNIIVDAHLGSEDRFVVFFFFSSRRRHTRFDCDWSSDVCSSDLDYPLLRMAAAPDVEVYLVDSQEPPSGAGEMGMPTVAPALVNAIFAASGKRIRRLPVGDQLKGSSAAS